MSGPLQTTITLVPRTATQVVSLHYNSNGTYKLKDCKFKVQEGRGADDTKVRTSGVKTVAKTAMVDLAQYCSEIGLPREEPVKVPLQ